MQAASDELNCGQLALDIGVGAVTGMLGASGISQLGATFAGAGIGGLSNLASQLIQGTSFNDIKWSQVLVGVAIGAAAGFLGGAGAKNAKAINNAKGVKEATNHYNKIATKIANGNKSRSITNATKILNAAIKDQKSLMFGGAMLWSGISTFSSAIVYMFGNENNLWPF